MFEFKLQFTELLIRSFLGFLFLFQGYDKLFKIKMKGVIATFTVDSDKQHIPRGFVIMMAYYTSIIELIGGVCLLLGLFTTYTLFALGFDLLLVCFAFSYMQPMWDLKHVFPRFLLIIILLVFPENDHVFSLDGLLQLRNR
ncbi:MAG: DoxX family protein [Bacteroidia bacterium]